MVPQLKTKNKPQKIGKPEQWKTKMSHYSKKSARLRKCQNKKTFFFFKKRLIILDVHPPFVCCFMSLWSVAQKMLKYAVLQRSVCLWGRWQISEAQWSEGTSHLANVVAQKVANIWKSGEYLRRTRQKSNHNRPAGWEMGTTQWNDVYRVFTLINCPILISNFFSKHASKILPLEGRLNCYLTIHQILRLGWWLWTVFTERETDNLLLAVTSLELGFWCFRIRRFPLL